MDMDVDIVLHPRIFSWIDSWPGDGYGYGYGFGRPVQTRPVAILTWRRVKKYYTNSCSSSYSIDHVKYVMHIIYISFFFSKRQANAGPSTSAIKETSSNMLISYFPRAKLNGLNNLL